MAQFRGEEPAVAAGHGCLLHEEPMASSQLMIDVFREEG
jgi:hypothetical protein